MAKPKPEPELEYIIVTEQTRVELQTRVNDYIGAGYAPVGGVEVQVGRTIYGELSITFYQSMVRKTE